MGPPGDDAQAHCPWDRGRRSSSSSSSSSSSYLTSPHLTSPHLTSPHLTSPHLTSPHLASPHLTSPHLTSPHLTSPHLPYLIRFAIAKLTRIEKVIGVIAMNEAVRTWPPRRYSAYGTKWWRSQVHKFLWRPNAAQQAHIAAVGKAIRWPSNEPIVGMHIRRGADKWKGEEMRLLSKAAPGGEYKFIIGRGLANNLTYFVEALDAVNQKRQERSELPFKNVYLASDDASIIKSAEGFAHRYRFFFNPKEARNVDYRFTAVSGYDLFAVLHFLAKTDLMIFPMSSCFSRMAFLLQIASHPSAFGISMDVSFYLNP